MIDLPIDVVPGTDLPRFRWRQVLGTPIGQRVVDHEGPLPPSVEGAVAALVALARRLEGERDAANRRANAAETLNSNQRQMLDQAKQPVPQVSSSKKIKGAG